MSVFQKTLILALSLFCFSLPVDGSECQRKDSETCRNVGSLKGLVYMMESVSSALADIVSSTKYRAENIEDDICISPKTVNCSSRASDDDDYDHCVKAESDCKALHDLGFKKSGPYRVWPTFLNHSINVYCDMETDGGGWTVIQRRGDFEPHIDFYETWDSYKKGFGNIQKEFWLGNDAIFALTNQGKTYLRIELEDFAGDRRYAKYTNFLVSSEVEKYKVNVGGYEGNAGDSFASKHHGYVFSTKDLDASPNCPKKFKGGWWYEKCHEANLNGIYHHGNHSSFADGINWFQFRGHHHSMKFAEMKIRRCDC